MGPPHAIGWILTIPPVATGLGYLAINSLRRARKEGQHHAHLEEALQKHAPEGSRRKGSWTEQTTQSPTPHNGLN